MLDLLDLAAVAFASSAGTTVAVVALGVFVRHYVFSPQEPAGHAEPTMVECLECGEPKPLYGACPECGYEGALDGD